MITHIGKQLATQIVDTVHDVCGHDINFINKNGIIYASTNTSRIGTFHEIGKKAADTGSVIEVKESDHYEGTSAGVNIPVTHNGLPSSESAAHRMKSVSLPIWLKRSRSF